MCWCIIGEYARTIIQLPDILQVITSLMYKAILAEHACKLIYELLYDGK